MNSTSERLKAARNKEKGILLPDMAPFAGLFFLVVAFYALTSQFKGTEVGIISNDQLPFTSKWNRGKTPEYCEAVTSLNAENHLSFAVDCPAIQAAAIREVASRHRIKLTPLQLDRLKTLSFLATTVENLPALLSLQDYQYRQAVELRRRGPLNEKQLAECLAAAKAFTKTLPHVPIHFAFKISPEVRMAQVGHLFDVLQSLGISRYTLYTQVK